MIASRREIKVRKELIRDYQGALNDAGFFDTPHRVMTISVLAEDGMGTRVLITKSNIRFFSVFDDSDSEVGGLWSEIGWPL